MLNKPPFGPWVGLGSPPTRWPLRRALLPSIWLETGLNAPTKNLFDDFGGAAINPTKWGFDSLDPTALFSNSGTATQSGGKVRLGCGTTSAFDNDCHLVSRGPYDLRGSEVVINMTPSAAPTTVGGEFECGLHIHHGPQDQNSTSYYSSFITWVVDRSQAGTNSLTAAIENNGSFTFANSITYSPTTHKYLRVKEAGGTLFFDTASSSASDPPIESDWTNQFSATVTSVVSYPLNTCSVMLYFRLTGAIGSTSEAFVDFDAVNTASTSATVVGLTTVLATGLVNSPTVAEDFALNNTSVLATGLVNTTSVTDQAALTTVLGTGAVNTTTVSGQVALATVLGTGVVNTVSVTIAPASLTTVLGTGAVNTTSVTVTPGLTTVLGTGAVNTTSVTGAVSVTTVLGTGAVNTTSVSDTVGLTTVLGTGLPGTVSGFDLVGLTTVLGTGLPGTVSGFDLVGLTTVLGTGLPGDVAASADAPDAFVTGVVAPGAAGTPSVAVATSVSGFQATGLAGNVLANPPVSTNRNHTDLFIRQFLEDYYTREWQKKPEPKKPETAAPKAPPKAKLVRRAVEQDQYLLLNPEVMRLAADTQALKVSLASLQHSFTVQSQPSASEEDEDDLLLLSSVL